MAGFPSEKDTISAVRGLVKGGADIIELGMPFSDPIGRWTCNSKCRFSMHYKKE